MLPAVDVAKASGGCIYRFCRKGRVRAKDEGQRIRDWGRGEEKAANSAREALICSIMSGILMLCLRLSFSQDTPLSF